jgi:organic hydroperoxide reductase OsmC/OhrA
MLEKSYSFFLSIGVNFHKSIYLKIMSKYIATIRWNRNGAAFTDQKYQRLHTWSFENGLTMKAAASPNIVPVSCTDPSVIDPEEAFTASVASCHMLWFLSIAAGRGYIVNQYSDRLREC